MLAQRLWRLDQVLRLLEPCEVSRRGCDNALPLVFVSLPSSTELKRKEKNAIKKAYQFFRFLVAYVLVLSN